MEPARRYLQRNMVFQELLVRFHGNMEGRTSCWCFIRSTGRRCLFRLVLDCFQRHAKKKPTIVGGSLLRQIRQFCKQCYLKPARTIRSQSRNIMANRSFKKKKKKQEKRRRSKTIVESLTIKPDDRALWMRS